MKPGLVNVISVRLFYYMSLLTQNCSHLNAVVVFLGSFDSCHADSRHKDQSHAWLDATTNKPERGEGGGKGKRCLSSKAFIDPSKWNPLLLLVLSGPGRPAHQPGARAYGSAHQLSAQQRSMHKDGACQHLEHLCSATKLHMATDYEGSSSLFILSP